MQQIRKIMQIGFQVSTTLDFLFGRLVFVRLDECCRKFFVFDSGMLTGLHEFHGFFRMFTDPSMGLFKSAEKSLDFSRFF